MRIGTDIIEIERIQKAYSRQVRFASKILAPEELLLFQDYSGKRQMSFLAGRFSAKEAYAKALRTGIGILRFTDISILTGNHGAPYLAKAPITEGVELSISHSRDYATATVLINLEEEVIEKQIEAFIQKRQLEK